LRNPFLAEMVYKNRNRPNRFNTIGIINNNIIIVIINTTVPSMLVFHERSTRTGNHLIRP
jgi:hypothetical protein